MLFTLLGSGTSTGVPLPGCNCETCTSQDPKDNRLRTSLHIEGNEHSLVIDTGPDFRAQTLKNNITHLDSVIFTHTHADHLFGLDDVRPFCYKKKSDLPIWGSKESLDEIKRIFSYMFKRNSNYLGSPTPKITLNEIDPHKKFSSGGIEITPIPVIHGRWPVLGFRVGKFAFITDCSEIPPSSMKLLNNLDILIIDGLRDRPHPTHFSFDQAAKTAIGLNAGKTFLTHLSHEITHEKANKLLASRYSEDIQLGFDGLKLEL